MEDTTPIIADETISTQTPEEVITPEVVYTPEQVETVETKTCDSCGAVSELFDVPHHQAGNATVWHYCKRCKLAHDVEVATNEKLQEVMAVNPAAVNDPVFVADVRNQVTQDIIQG